MSREQRRDATSAISRGGLTEDVFMDPNLEPDQVQAPPESTDLGHHVLLVLAQQREPLLLVPRLP
jgi:hypothetical protein